MADSDQTHLVASETDTEGNTRRRHYGSTGSERPEGGNETEPKSPEGGNGKELSRYERFCKWLDRGPFEMIEVEFLVIAAATTITLLAFSSIRIRDLKTSNKPHASEVVMLLTELFCQYYIFHGILCQRLYEIVFYIVVILLDVIYCTIDFDHIASPITYEKHRDGLRNRIYEEAITFAFGLAAVIIRVVIYVLSIITLNKKKLDSEDGEAGGQSTPRAARDIEEGTSAVVEMSTPVLIDCLDKYAKSAISCTTWMRDAGGNASIVSAVTADFLRG